MLVDYTVLNNKLSNAILNNQESLTWISEVQNKLKLKYNLPQKVVFKYLTLSSSFTGAEEEVLYALVDTCCGADIVEQIYTPKEIERFSNYKYGVDPVDFPIVLDALEVGDDEKHFIMSGNTNLLMQWGDAGLIFYNEKTQRVVKKKNGRNGNFYWQIQLNQPQVIAITEAMRNGTYIPNAITLNIPEDADFTYNPRTKQITINSLDHFDIIDGYHRYIAMRRNHAVNPEWSCPIEIRVLAFTEQEAQQFIWQEDQKVKMVKVDSDSLNQYNAGNKVAEMLNKGILFHYENIINKSLLSACINYLWFRSNNAPTRAEIIEVRNDIYKTFEEMLDDDPTMLDKNWSVYKVVCAIYLIHQNKFSLERCEKLIDKCNANKITRSRDCANVIIKKVQKFDEEV